MLLKRKGFFALIMILMGVLLVGCGDDGASKDGDGKASSDDVYEININNWASSTHHYAYNVFEPWKEIVEEKTEGRVKVNIYHGASLGKSTSVYQDIKGGLYEVSIAPTQHFPDTNLFPMTVGNLPFAFEGSEEASNVMKKFMEKYVYEELSNEFVVMPPSATDAYDLFSTKPIKSVDDMKNLKMRANGKSEIELIKTLGSVPVSMSTEDIYEGLQRKSIETTFYTPIGAVGMKYHEPAPYITKVNASVVIFLPLMNKDFFDSLPEDLQKLFQEELNPALSELITKSYESELGKSYKTLEEEVAGRGEIITFPENEMKRLKESGKPAWDSWVEDANSKGYPGQEMVDELLKMLDEAGYPAPY